MTGKDLRAIFALLRKDGNGRVPAHAVLLLRSLAIMARHQGPTTFFDFANEGAGIMRNTPLRFPGKQASTALVAFAASCYMMYRLALVHNSFSLCIRAS